MSVNYEYWATINNETEKNSFRNDICFREIFQIIGGGNWPSSYPYKINKLIVDIYIFSEGRDNYDNKLILSPEEMLIVFEKTNKIWDIPIITIADTDDLFKIYGTSSFKNPIYKLHFDFSNRTRIYILSNLTFARYLWENNVGMGRIIKESLKWSTKIPEIPFIEIFAICHNSIDYCYSNSNHSLIQVNSSYDDPEIYTEDCIIEKLKNYEEKSCHTVFGLKYDKSRITRTSSTQKITEEIIKNFKKTSC